MSDQNDNPQVSVPPVEDARLPILEAEIEREWNNHRRAYAKVLNAEGNLQQRIKETALWCAEVLDEYQIRGLGADQGWEAIRGLILPQTDMS